MSDTALLAGLAASAGVALLLLGVVVAYREGKRIGSLTRSDRFDRLPTSLRLGNTEWLVRYTDYGGGSPQEHRAWMRFRQYDSRIIGDGEDFDGRRWSAEGIVFHDRLCYVYLDRGPTEHALGAVMVDWREADGSFEGMRCVWSEDRNALTVQPIRLVPTRPAAVAGRTPPADAPSAPRLAVVHSGDRR